MPRKTLFGGVHFLFSGNYEPISWCSSINHNKGNTMITKRYFSLKEQLNRIERKIDGQFSDNYLDINQVSKLTSLSLSTIRRRVSLGELKCTRRLGKLLFKKSQVEDWLNG